MWREFAILVVLVLLSSTECIAGWPRLRATWPSVKTESHWPVVVQPEVKPIESKVDECADGSCGKVRRGLFSRFRR